MAGAETPAGAGLRLLPGGWMLPSRQVNAPPTNAAGAVGRMTAPTTNQSHTRHGHRSSCQSRTRVTRFAERIEDEKGGYIPEYQKPAPAASEISQILGNHHPSTFAVLIDHQQQTAHDRQVLEQLNPLHPVGHISVEQQGGGYQEHQQQHRSQSGLPAADHQR